MKSIIKAAAITASLTLGGPAFAQGLPEVHPEPIYQLFAPTDLIFFLDAGYVSVSQEDFIFLGVTEEPGNCPGVDCSVASTTYYYRVALCDSEIQQINSDISSVYLETETDISSSSQNFFLSNFVTVEDRTDPSHQLFTAVYPHSNGYVGFATTIDWMDLNDAMGEISSVASLSLHEPDHVTNMFIDVVSVPCWAFVP